MSIRKFDWHRLGPVVSLLFLLAAAWVLDRELKHVHYHAVLRELRALPGGRIGLAALFTLISYACLVGYESLALRYARHPLKIGQTVVASFVSYAFSHSTGFLVGAPLRYRFYTGWGLSGIEITTVLLFSYATFWLGHFVVTGTALLMEPTVLPSLVDMPISSLLWLGLLLLAVVAGYLLFVALRRSPLRLRNFEITIPSWRLAVGQVVMGSLDWMAAGLALYVLLPEGAISLPTFMVVFMLGHTAGVISQVPGGLGVFESVLLTVFAPTMPAASVLGPLVAYRAIYYVGPLIAAATTVGISELARHWQRLQHAATLVSTWLSGIVPQLFALLIFVGGTILLLSGATPSIHGRLAWLDRILPLPIVELSHFLGSVVGACLLLLARGIQRRLDAAYYATALLLSGGVVFSLLKGLDFEEAIILCLMLIALLPCHRYFYRKSSLLSEPLSQTWIIAVVLVLAGSIWVGFFSYKRVEYSHELWWKFETMHDAPRFLRATAGALIVAALWGFARLLRPAPQIHLRPTAADADQAEIIIRQNPNTEGFLALLGDKSLLFSAERDAFLMYGVEGRSWIALGDPLGSAEAYDDLVWQFHELSKRRSGWTVFYHVAPAHLPLYIDLGLSLIKIGEEARVPLATFSLEGRANKNLRHAHARPFENGCTFQVLESSAVRPLLPELKRISDSWLNDRHVREKGFSLGFFDESYLSRCRLALVTVEDKPVAFANILAAAPGTELSVDLMRYDAQAPAGVMDFLFVELMLWGRRQNFAWFNLGMAPFSGLETRLLAPLWTRLGSFIFAHGEYLYNFQGVRQYKEKFRPVWEPRYLASPGGLALPVVLTNLASLIGGGLKGVVTK
jgi:phosphatidylglycerol lysyltransferase